MFINRRDEPETVREIVKQFAESGMKVIYMFLFWDYVEQFEDVWDFSQFAAQVRVHVCGSDGRYYPSSGQAVLGDESAFRNHA